MKTYNEPEMEIIHFAVEDIIAASGPTLGPDDTDWG